MTLKFCPVAYDHDDDPCAVCGWDPSACGEPAREPSGAVAWITALNGLIADRNCCAPTEETSK
jgi:hypothetical protein